jgi:hypothetical protein
MIISEKITSEKLIFQHLYKYYDVLNWGEDLDSFLKENLDFCNDYNGFLIKFKKDQSILGGLLLYFNHNFNSHVIGCAAIDPLHRKQGYYTQIMINFNQEYCRLYFFCQPHLVKFYSKFFKYIKKVEDQQIYIVSNYILTKEDDGPFF